MKKNILILFAHPALQKSRVNRYLIDGLEYLDGVSFHDLYEAYPEFDIDIKREQQLLLEHDVIIFHHPFFWYSTPAILKEWQDLVLEHGWAYGSRGNKLEGKIFMNVISSGGKADAYQHEGYNRFTIRELIRPLERTALLCKMIFLPPYVVHGTHTISEEDLESHKINYYSFITELREDKIPLEETSKLEYMNDYLNQKFKS